MAAELNSKGLQLLKEAIPPIARGERSPATAHSCPMQLATTRLSAVRPFTSTRFYAGHPGDLPTEQRTKFELGANLKTPEGSRRYYSGINVDACG
jgi:hypothetical protein